VVILEQLTASQEVEEQRVLRIVHLGGFEVAVAVFVTTPVDNSTLDWANHVVNGQQQVKHPVWRVEQDKKPCTSSQRGYGRASFGQTCRLGANPEGKGSVIAHRAGCLYG